MYYAHVSFCTYIANFTSNTAYLILNISNVHVHTSLAVTKSKELPATPLCRESHRYGGSYYTGRPSKGDAIAIAQAYRRKKRQEELMGDIELQKAEKPTRRQDQPDSKISTKKSVVPLEVRGALIELCA